MAQNWTCPHCNRPQTVTDGQYRVRDSDLVIGQNKFGYVGIRTEAWACANPDCRDVTLNAYFTTGVGKFQNFQSTGTIENYALRPQSAAKPQPDYIPGAIREDYFEACLIKNMSPKASATLSRRCLQGMIRDFCKISKPTLFKEIEELRKQLDVGDAAKGVTYESVDAIDAVRSVGNIGAHMEKDVDLIVEIEPGEAQMLIELIELLLDEWYVERHKRSQRLAEITALSAKKASELAEAALIKSLEGSAVPVPTDAPVALFFKTGEDL